MTPFLLLVAIGALVYLLLAAANVASRVTTLEPYSTGRWGFVSWRPTRKRLLDAHEQRWQKALVAAKDSDTKWRDLIALLDGLQSAAGVASVGVAPDRYDQRWIERRILHLESAIADYAPGDPNR